ncbi:NAD-dependent succinate-semialdehyde dehydrogenase [Stenotrophomonas sp. ZAC14D2_NAIMI4_6]|uniref:NAD-dependent succinate-semialdehyde dehydrogenase n=1 Tax=Stenotrophomonas sp. ZAC14D2_NAIMI4_6 TaxID=2072406 RepID=UPI000D54149E|nr:NAD-dependent succinate-semialdehyde dehydrogenase [Stenotrophomonas sp. ZAC14D2_NAIMI4_6]AWH23385.1 succinate-semialdehyde dehydrogenase [Stenotrophomonas sp. ZAC14D2_NAIMI4_6]
MTKQQLTTINPLTEQVLDTYAYMSDVQAADTVKTCHEAFLQWRLRSLEERAAVVAAIARKLEEKKEAFAQLMTNEVGKLIGDSRSEVDLCVAICKYTAERGPTVLADEERPSANGIGIVTHAPIGVVYGIQPWNFPAYQAVRYSIASLMAGNGVLLKHAESCTGSGLFLRDLYEEAGLPKGLFGVLLISHDQSDAIIDHDLVRAVTLTGSEKAGRTVAEKAGKALKKTMLELGSNDAYLVLDDADLELAVKTCVKGRLFNNGQTCVNAKRFVVTEKNYDAFVEAYAKQFEQIRMGDPNDGKTQLGPMVSKAQRDTLHEQVSKSVAQGARLVVGGEVPAKTGWFYPATVLADVVPGQVAYEDELFGPAAAIIKAKDDDDAMRIANDSRYGLGGGIFSRDVKRARELASTYFDTGMVCINGFNVAGPTLPFGGVKASGYGREHGPEGLKEFVNIKSITLPAGA